MRTYPIPADVLPDTPEHAVHAVGAPWLDTVRSDWFNELDLERLLMQDGCRCVLGQFVKKEAAVLDIDLDGYWTVVAVYENCVPDRLAAVQDIDDLASLCMTVATAKERGFHADTNDTQDGSDWWRLTQAWRTAAEIRLAAGT